MALLKVKNLTHKFGDKTLYMGAEFEIYKGEHIGIVGQNGTGKTTLMRSLSGDIIPDVGEIVWQNRVQKGYLDQHAELQKGFTIFEYMKTAFQDLLDIAERLDELYKKMETDSSDEIVNKASKLQDYLLSNEYYEIETKVSKVASGLGITAIGMDKPLWKLSGGQRAKVILGKLLLQRPDILMLDEPTNFLDTEHIAWLTEYLKNFDGAFLLISHDFKFLDDVTTAILDIEFQRITKYSGNFKKFLVTKKMNEETYVRNYNKQQEEIKHHEKFINRFRYKASHAKQAQSLIKKIDRMDKLTAPKKLPKPNFKIVSTAPPQNKSLVVTNLEVGYNRKPLLPEISFKLSASEKIAITGFNGIGKSTFLKTLVGKIPAVSGSFAFAQKVKIAYFEQDLNWKQDITPLEIVSDEFPKMTESEIRKALANFSVTSKHIMQNIKTLSGGEQTKVKLCILANQKSNFLLLDEPTNHMDEASKEVLYDQLKKWQGAFIIVSHDPNFYNDIVDRVIKF